LVHDDPEWDLEILVAPPRQTRMFSSMVQGPPKTFHQVDPAEFPTLQEASQVRVTSNGTGTEVKDPKHGRERSRSPARDSTDRPGKGHGAAVEANEAMEIETQKDVCVEL